MDEPTGILEAILVGIIALLVIWWFRPGLRAAFQRSRSTEHHWGDLLLPIGWVIAFVIFLILIV